MKSAAILGMQHPTLLTWPISHVVDDVTQMHLLAGGTALLSQGIMYMFNYLGQYLHQKLLEIIKI